ncbi:late embryogenesis abundant protein 6-like [Lycium barbarum]|uniref:late embryogenesis abundant protein 6-like n=1 Tax=Lycium ferocissimum TaxID=112874 RepID=UPI0028157FD6|nr:late embryogenesis abundant protein 6-like [Lycium ferocissimum]XP_060169058.1 late embryogenesis abundant protein 6-like [Lycium barbarum]
MQAIKEKFNDMSAMRKAKAEAKEEEKAEKELAKARVEVAHEVRLAREAEAAMDLHVNKAAEKIAHEEEKHVHNINEGTLDPYAASFTNTNNPTGGDPYGLGANHSGQLNNAGTGPTNNLL